MRNLTPNPFPSGKGNWNYAGVVDDPKNLTPNPFPSGKGNKISRESVRRIVIQESL